VLPQKRERDPADVFSPPFGLVSFLQENKQNVSGKTCSFSMLDQKPLLPAQATEGPTQALPAVSCYLCFHDGMISAGLNVRGIGVGRLD